MIQRKKTKGRRGERRKADNRFKRVKRKQGEKRKKVARKDYWNEQGPEDKENKENKK